MAGGPRRGGRGRQRRGNDKGKEPVGEQSTREGKGKEPVVQEPVEGEGKEPVLEGWQLFGADDIPNHFRFRPTVVSKLTLIIWHKGHFVFEPTCAYVEGESEILPGWDPDQINSIEVDKIVTAHLGYASYKCLWYRAPTLGLFDGRRPLRDDGDVHQFLSDVKGFSEVEFYVEHLEETGVQTGELQKGTQIFVEDIDSETESAFVSVAREAEAEIDSLARGVSEVRAVSEVVSEESVVHEGVSEKRVLPEGVREEVVVHGGVSEQRTVSEVVSEQGVQQNIVSLTGEHISDDDSLDDDYEALSGEEESDDVSLDDSDFDERWEWTTVLPTGDVEAVTSLLGSQNPNSTNYDSFEDEYGDSSDLDTPPGSDSDTEERPKFPKFKQKEDDSEVRFEVGQIFSSAALLKNAVKDYALQNKKNVYLEKNDPKRVVVKCTEECVFYLRASKYKQNTYFQIVTLYDEHTCVRTSKNRQAKTKWIAKKFVSMLRHTPSLKVGALVEEAKIRWGVVLSRFQAYRAKVTELEMIQGAVLEQYRHLRSFGEELLRSNPGSTVKIKSVVGAGNPVFERIYICFAACKRAFATCCRPLIGLDGCFLKGLYGGQLLAAVGKDGNNQMIPIAFAVVEAETKDSWAWFVHLLVDDLSSVSPNAWAFISDQQKGLVPTLQELDPNVEHRLCVKHLYGNWRKKYPGQEMKGALWAATRASTGPEFERAMDHMKTLNEEAWKDMMEVPAKMWSRSAFSTNTVCDLQVNNMCEAFNRAILEWRDKPIITLIEGLKYYITNRIVKQRELMLKYRGAICPMIQQKLEVNKQKADNWIPMWNGDGGYTLFEVSRSQTDKHSVNLATKTCSCRRWDLSGIPCCHAITCMWHNHVAPEEYVHPCYSKQNFLATYDHIILPSNGPKLWPISRYPPLDPPFMRRAPGRPKKQRRKTNDEPRDPNRLRRYQTTIQCRRCGEPGHNKRTCTGKQAADRAIPVGGNKDNSQMLHPEQRASGSGSAQARNDGAVETGEQEQLLTTRRRTRRASGSGANQQGNDAAVETGAQQPGVTTTKRTTRASGIGAASEGNGVAVDTNAHEAAPTRRRPPRASRRRQPQGEASQAAQPVQNHQPIQPQQPVQAPYILTQCSQTASSITTHAPGVASGSQGTGRPGKKQKLVVLG
ncbi:uncharacterized protein LOC130717437 [Lotus japonicus]|uniref:uncharacterized protein LOC130717437 n=1 Tax=Lotus japonicus TaxID=34305 RepID=UPI00258D7271|nr:uncharacterized protein LOC130717437 [Lotus japonicus]